MYKQDPDGFQPYDHTSYGWKDRISRWCFKKGFWRTGNFFEWWDERGLGR